MKLILLSSELILSKFNFSSLRRLIFVFFLFLTIIGSSVQTSANSILIPWTVNEAYNDIPLSQNIALGGGSGGDVTGAHAYLNFNTNSTYNASWLLPFSIQMSAPNTAYPGQWVPITSSVQIAGLPSFSTSYSGDFGTSFQLDAHVAGVGGSVDVPMPNTYSYDAATATFGGTFSSSETTNTASQVQTYPMPVIDPWKSYLDPIYAPAVPLNAFQLNNQSQNDGWELGVDILSLIGDFYPPIKAIAYLVDVNASMGLDIVHQDSLMTNLVVANAIDQFGSSKTLVLNYNDTAFYPFIHIPETLNSGDTYEVQINALGLKDQLTTSYYLQGNLDFDLELISYWSLDIGEINVGNPMLVDQEQASSWPWLNVVQNLQDFLSPEAFGGAKLVFNIVSNPIPEPSTLLLLGAGLAGVGLLRRRFKK